VRLIDINSNTIDLKQYSGVTDNSKDVVSGGIFVAVKGHLFDGHDYINEAIASGAGLIIIDASKKYLLTSISKASVSIVDDSRIALCYIASQIYSKPDNIVAVTGTNGKSSVVYFFQQLLFLLGIDAASIGTLGIISGNDTIIDKSGSLTTLGALQLYKTLHKLKQDKKINYVALEASSHGLIQHRMDYVPLKGAGFTSFTRDHLDYHKTMEEYLKAKFYLFETLLSSGSFALINSEMEILAPLLKICNERGIRALTYGHGGNFLRIKSIKYSDNNAFNVEIAAAAQTYQFVSDFLGRFQIYNILCAIGFLLELGFNIEKILPLIEKLSDVPGRMQRVASSNVYIDYAHTPDALENALNSIKEFISHRKKLGKVIVVFGCGGDRDKGKRFEMGKIASNIADIVIVTDDNPRSEDASSIRKEILRGCPKAKEVPDRKEAIKYAIENSKPTDIILLAGKGHEQYQIIVDKSMEFDEAELARKYLNL
jgi:UDP-N-acetylmuramoyl-L-alanyl-D-glutamate--2,6-diaminopimelate ligase